jgi:predicted nucleotidyltransferase component of viral defense system
MITRQEIMDASREFGLGAHIIEKDYVLGWLLDGISKHVIGNDWIFKGGTCLKKCYFETYRFSEDLDFTVPQQNHLNVDFLTEAFREIADSLYNEAGLEIPKDLIRFEIYENPRGTLSAEGKISYRGPMQQRGDLPRVKLDLTTDEIIVLPPQIREVRHTYSDKPQNGIFVQCYCFEEVFAEKIRALAQRLRPRDLYDVIHLYHHHGVTPDHDILNKTLKQKCDYKSILPPTAKSLAERPERLELEAEWENMLAHQLPALPPYEQFWHKLPEMFEWLYGVVRKVAAAPISFAEMEVVTTMQMPAMSRIWYDRTTAPLYLIRFAAANHLCVDLQYQGSSQMIEPYSLRMTKKGDLLLYAVKHDTREECSYLADRIGGAQITDMSFTPKYRIELTENNV